MTARHDFPTSVRKARRLHITKHLPTCNKLEGAWSKIVTLTRVWQIQERGNMIFNSTMNSTPKTYVWQTPQARVQFLQFQWQYTVYNPYDLCTKQNLVNTYAYAKTRTTSLRWPSNYWCCRVHPFRRAFVPARKSLGGSKSIQVIMFSSHLAAQTFQVMVDHS